MNRKIFIKNLIIACGLLVFATVQTGCKKQLNINQNPNFPATGTPSIVFPVGVLATAGEVGGNLAIVGGSNRSQLFGGRQNVSKVRTCVTCRSHETAMAEHAAANVQRISYIGQFEFGPRFQVRR